MLESAARHLPQVLMLKNGPLATWGWGPVLRQRFGYVTPDDWYEATVFGLITETTSWLDVGCGRDVFPFNRLTAKLLAERCRLLVGVDPSSNIDENILVHERAKCMLEEYQSTRQFDLVTMRMVAEHICDPRNAVVALARLTRRGGIVAVYTVHKWSPASIVAAITPLPVHVLAQRLLWQSAARDIFPTAYRLNTRANLLYHFSRAGFTEFSFSYLDDCRSFARWKVMSHMELMAWKTFKSMRLSYPERCILALYRKA